MSPTLLTSVVGHLSRRFLPSDLTFGQPPQHLDEKQVEKDPADAAQREGLRRKRIIICCDGTWQSSATGRKNVPSNVTRLARSIARTGKMKNKDGNEVDCEQVVYYSPGIGTGDGVNIVERARQATFGDGLVSDVIKAYSFVVMNYSKYDEISCFGFSRGAYTARAVAGLITDIGIIEPRELDDFPELYALYRKCGSNSSFGFRQSPEYREWIMGVRKNGYKYRDTDGKKLDNHWEQVPHTLPAEFTRVVHVVGVFDTVGALGIPYMAWTREISNFFARTIPFFGVDEYGFHNPSLSRYINHAFHALALDDKKTAFTPTLWRLPKDHQQAPKRHPETRAQLAEKLRRLLNVKHPNEKTKKDINKAWAAMVEREMWDQLKDDTSTDEKPKFHKPKLQQVWFPGSHQNIGGGNPGILLGAPYDCELRPFLNFDDEKRDEANDDGPETLSTLADREIESRKKLIEFSQQSQDIRSKVVKFGRYFLGLFNLVKTGEDNQDWALGPIIGDTTFIEGRLLLVSIFRLVLRFLFDLFFGRVFHFLFNDRTPGEYTLDDHQNEAGITNEKVHPAVRYRMEKDSRYRPGALKSFESEKKFAKVSGGNEYVYKWAKGNLTLPEYVIKPDDHISRQLISQSKKGNQWIKNL
ncbi:hypothetical protein K4K59_007494 [Colletotrichum sp. SAR11_240]|nr:hypothetical protein K4K59_007494 [Colletotrichum sp. SAR11_240]